MNALKRLALKHQKLLTYVACSLATALLETAAGWCLITLAGVELVPANTLAILVGAAAHYFLTLALVFRLKNNIGSALGYVVTFALGMIAQNAVIWLFHDVLLVSLPDLPRYLISKGFSLALPFVMTYYLRSVVNQAILTRSEKSREKDNGHASMLQ